MNKEEILVAKKHGYEKIKFKVCNKERNKWSPSKYEKVIAGRDYNLLAFLFYDLNSMGYNVEKAFLKFKSMLNEPDLFFLK